MREREGEMLPLKLVRSLVSGDAIANPTSFATLPFHQICDQTDHENIAAITNMSNSTGKIPLMLFVPTKELVKDSYRLATLARDIGMDLFPNPSLSHIIFSWPVVPHSITSSSSSSSLLLSNDAAPLPFPSLATASLSHLRLFANLSKGFFKLVFLKSNHNPFDEISFYSSNNNWDVTTLSLISRKTGVRIDSMDGFTKTLLGVGWTLFKTNKSSKDSVVYLYRKLDLNRVHFRWPCEKENGNCRVRELRLPQLDFKNAPLRILHYILLMTDDIFYLA
ncbi:uncharacterized protein [Nicotiana tomentosiformis]|uniref:Uncharacterized protein n=1 Tax=Nicotiana tabacum TaxID=4097 RepID=A0A1S4A0Z4_TOBAC|nr:uncharacterized protein LOC104109497 [Nicotiana tomentosiformis]XP_016470352.1 PREDICTED: uncharacterized protein LOC107792627 [Nicotiana tabacum]